MPIPDKVVEEVRQVADIVEVVGDYVKLKPSGGRFKGLCPFHNEKSPSFSVDPDQGLFYCFGCQKGGDLFTFVREIEGLGFIESVRQLAERYHIEIPEDGPADPAQSEREAILQLLRFAAGFFFRQLSTPEGEACFAYFRQRGLTKETIRQFGLGYAPKRWDALVQAAEAEGYKPELLVKAGLAKERRGGGGLYDLFRGRAMFPILSHVGKVLAFGGRVIPGVTEPFGDGDPPKYINSPETPVYHKSDVLYGLYQARRAVRQAEELIMVEGYTDVIALHQAGVPLAVASSGTALTPQQVRLAGRYAKTVVLLYDADRAGAAAALRAVDLVLEAGLVPYAVTLPDGADPDSFVKLAGADGLRKEMKEAKQDFVSFQVLTARRAGDLDSPERKAAVANALVESIAKIQDPIMQDGYIIRAGSELGIPDNTLREQLRNRFKQQRDAPAERPRPPARGVDREEHAQPDALPPPAFAEPKPEEAALLRLMLEHGAAMVEHVLTRMGLGEFSPGAARDAASQLAEQYQSGQIDKRPFLEGDFGAPVQALAASVLADRYGVSQSQKALEVTGAAIPQQDAAPYEAATSAMKFLKLDRVDEAITAVNAAIHRAAAHDEDLVPLMTKLQELQRLKQRIGSGAYFENADEEG
jgi:DNA primase